MLFPITQSSEQGASPSFGRPRRASDEVIEGPPVKRQNTAGAFSTVELAVNHGKLAHQMGIDGGPMSQSLMTAANFENQQQATQTKLSPTQFPTAQLMSRRKLDFGKSPLIESLNQTKFPNKIGQSPFIAQKEESKPVSQVEEKASNQEPPTMPQQAYPDTPI